MTRLVALDANALLMPFQFRVNLDAELRRLLGDVDIRVPTPVIEELRVLAESGREAQSALRLSEKYRPLESSGSADDALVDLAASRGAVVVTNDAALLGRLRESGFPRVFLRSRTHLVVEGL